MVGGDGCGEEGLCEELKAPSTQPLLIPELLLMGSPSTGQGSHLAHLELFKGLSCKVGSRKGEPALCARLGMFFLPGGIFFPQAKLSNNS